MCGEPSTYDLQSLLNMGGYAWAPRATPCIYACFMEKLCEREKNLAVFNSGYLKLLERPTVVQKKNV